MRASIVAASVDRLSYLRYADLQHGAQAGEVATNILGGFHRGLFVNLVALLFLVTAAYTLCLISIQLIVSSGALSENIVPAGVAAEGRPEVTITASPLSLFNSAVAISVGVGMALVAIGLFRRARWSYPGALIVSATMAVLIILQLLNGVEATGSAVLQLLLFAAIFGLFLYDTEIKQLLWLPAAVEAPVAEE